MEYWVKLAGVFGTAFVVGFSGAMMPGPLLAFTIGEASRRGSRAGPLVILGHMTLEAMLVAGVVFGCVGFLQNDVFVRVVSLAGGTVMAWMGQGMLRSARTASLGVVAGASGGVHPFTGGIMLSLANPYWTVWWATIGAGYIVMGLRFGLFGVLVFFVGHILSDFVWYTLVSVGVAKGRHLLSDRGYRVLMGVCGTAMAVFGVLFIINGLRVK